LSGSSNKLYTLFTKYMNIKDQNLNNMIEISQEAWGEWRSQTKMLTAIDYEKGTTQMAFLEPNVFKVKNVDEYTCT